MSFDMNMTIYGGRLTSDPKTFGDNKGCSFDVASNRFYKGEKYTTFMRVKVFGKLGEIAASKLSKGSGVIVIGRLDNSSYEDADGNKKKFTNIIADDLRFLSSFGSSAEDPEPSEEDTKVEDVLKLFT